MVDHCELIGAKAFGSVLSIGTKIAYARRNPKVTTTSALVNSALSTHSIRSNVRAWKQVRLLAINK